MRPAAAYRTAASARADRGAGDAAAQLPVSPAGRLSGAGLPAGVRRPRAGHAQRRRASDGIARRGARAGAPAEVPVLLRRLRAARAVLPRHPAVPPGAFRVPRGTAFRRRHELPRRGARHPPHRRGERPPGLPAGRLALKAGHCLRLEPAGGGHVGGGRLTGPRGRDARPLEVGDVDVRGGGRGGRRVQGREVGRPALVVVKHRRELGLQVRARVAGDQAGPQRSPADEAAAAHADRLRVALGLLVHVARDAGRGVVAVAVREQEADDRGHVLREHGVVQVAAQRARRAAGSRTRNGRGAVSRRGRRGRGMSRGGGAPRPSCSCAAGAARRLGRRGNQRGRRGRGVGPTGGIDHRGRARVRPADDRRARRAGVDHRRVQL